MKLRLIMQLLIIVAAFLFTGEVTGQTNASFGTIDVRTRETFRGPFYNYDTIFFKPLSVNIPWQSAGDSLGWFLTTSKGAEAKLCRVSMQTLFDTIFEIPFSATATSYAIPSGSEGVAFTDLATNDTLALGTAVGRGGDIIFVARTDQGHDTLVITGSPTFYYNETGYPTFYLGGSAAGCIIQSDGISWYVTGVFYETAWERDYVGEYIYMKNEDDSLFVNGKATFDSAVYVEDSFIAQYDNTYFGYDMFESGYPCLDISASDPNDTAAYIEVGHDTINSWYYTTIEIGNSSENRLAFSMMHMPGYAYNILESIDYIANKNSVILMTADSLTIGCGIPTPVIQSGVKIFEDSIAIVSDTIAFRGFIHYEDTFWDDITFPASQIKLGATAKPDYDFDELSLLFPYSDSTELIVANVQTPHRWSIGSDIYVHVHWIQSGANDTAEFILKYRWTDMGETQSASFTRIETTVCTYYNYVSGDLHQLAIFPAISGAGHTESSILDFKLFRKEDVGLNGDIEVKDFDIHYEINKPGSDNQTP